MKIVVLVKEVPDTYGERTLDPASGRLGRNGDVVLDEIDERAVEVALQVKDGDKATEVVVLAMGPTSTVGSLRRALAMGADRAVHVQDAGLVGADALLTSRVLAAALAREGFDLVLAGDASSDGGTGVVPAMVAERLGAAIAGGLDSVELDDGAVRGRREAGGASTELTAALPAVVTVSEKVAEARMPGFRGTMGAKRKPLDTLGLADLGLAGATSSTRVLSTMERPPREAGVRIAGDADAGRRVVEFLEARDLLSAER
jgi:electron transfer flavoprotein beta subunit